MHRFLPQKETGTIAYSIDSLFSTTEWTNSVLVKVRNFFDPIIHKPKGWKYKLTLGDFKDFQSGYEAFKADPSPEEGIIKVTSPLKVMSRHNIAFNQYDETGINRLPSSPGVLDASKRNYFFEITGYQLMVDPGIYKLLMECSRKAEVRFYMQTDTSYLGLSPEPIIHLGKGASTRRQTYKTLYLPVGLYKTKIYFFQEYEKSKDTAGGYSLSWSTPRDGLSYFNKRFLFHDYSKPTKDTDLDGMETIGKSM